MRVKRIQAMMIGLAAIILILAACEQTDSETPAVVSGSPAPIETTIEPNEVLAVVVTPTPEGGEAAAPPASSAGTVEATEETGTMEATEEAGAETPPEGTAEATEEAGTAEAAEEAGTMEATEEAGAETPQGTAEAEATAEAVAEATEEAAGTAEAADEAGTGVETEETDKPSEADTPQAEGAAETEATEEPAEAEAEAETPTAQLSDEQLVDMGEGLYMLNCAACHQENGQGIEGAYPPLAGNEFVLTEDPHPAIQVVYTGRAGMPRFQDYISNEEIAAILSYVRNAWENDASIVSTEQVQQVPETLLSEVEADEQ